jgi:hypothetical protein
MHHFTRSTALSYLFNGDEQCGFKAGRFKSVMNIDHRNTYTPVGNTVCQQLQV